MKNSGNKHAFTLIELLVVIAIIALLVSILLPSLQKAKELAKRAVCLSNLHGLGISTNLFLSENDGMLCPATNSPPGWQWHLDLEGFELDSGGQQVGTVPDILHCPSQEVKNEFSGSYAMNSRLGGGPWYPQLNITDFAQPSSKIAITDFNLVWPYCLVIEITPGDSIGLVDWGRHGWNNNGVGEVEVLWLDGRASSETGQQGYEGTIAMDPDDNYPYWLCP